MLFLFLRVQWPKQLGGTFISLFCITVTKQLHNFIKISFSFKIIFSLCSGVHSPRSGRHHWFLFGEELTDLSQRCDTMVTAYLRQNEPIMKYEVKRLGSIIHFKDIPRYWAKDLKVGSNLQKFDENSSYSVNQHVPTTWLLSNKT